MARPPIGTPKGKAARRVDGRGRHPADTGLGFAPVNLWTQPVRGIQFGHNAGYKGGFSDPQRPKGIRHLPRPGVNSLFGRLGNWLIDYRDNNDLGTPIALRNGAKRRFSHYLPVDQGSAADAPVSRASRMVNAPASCPSAHLAAHRPARPKR